MTNLPRPLHGIRITNWGNLRATSPVNYFPSNQKDIMTMAAKKDEIQEIQPVEPATEPVKPVEPEFIEVAADDVTEDVVQAGNLFVLKNTDYYQVKTLRYTMGETGAGYWTAIFNRGQEILNPVLYVVKYPVSE